MTVAQPQRPTTNRPRAWADSAILLLVAVVGGALSVLAGSALREAEELRARELRTAATQSVLSALDLDLTRITEVVRSAALMVESRDALERAEFNHYVEAVSVNLHSLEMLEWQPVVPASRLSQFEARARSAGQPNYRVIEPDPSGKGWVPVHGRAVYVPVLYAWPERIGTAGLDMGFSPERMKSKLESAAVGQPVASGVIDIMKEGLVHSGTKGIALSAPVYRRDQSVGGYVAAVLNLSTLFQETALRADGAKLDIVVFDLNAADAGPIYTWIGNGSDISDPTSLRRSSTSRLDQANTIEFARQSWEIILHPRPGFQANTHQRFSGWVLAGGLFMTSMILLAMARMQRSQRARARAQAQIEQLNAHLEQRVAERTEQLEAAMQTLHHSQEDLSRSEARATLGMLAASVSHEMGTPMGNSMMTASTLVDQSRTFEKQVASGTLRRSDLDQFLQQVNEGNALLVRNLERAADLLKNFRQVAADQASEQRRAFDLAQAVQEIVHTLAPSLKSKPHRVVLNIPAKIAMDSYPGPLGQVVINLINNAYLHAFDDHAPGLFTIVAHAEGDNVDLRFQDNGRGISPETLEHMFEPFFSTKIGTGGTGLGMSIVENLVTKTLGGRISVQSTLGKGTVVTVSLPLQAPRTEGGA